MTDFDSIVKSVYFRLIGQEAKPEVVVRWSADLARGNRSVDDFNRYLMRTREYEANVTYNFKKLYIQIIDENVDAELIKDLRVYSGSQPITEDVITQFLHTTDAFLAKYRTIIVNLWRVLKDATIEDTTLEYYLASFKADSSYDIARLQDDIIANSSRETVTSGRPIGDIADVIGAGVSIDEYNKVLDIMGNARLAAELFLASKDLTNHPKINALVALYPKYYDRDVTVVELLRVLPTLLATTDVEGAVQAGRKAYARVFEAVQATYKMYIDTVISDMYFIKNHLAALDEANIAAYTSGVVETIVRGDAYAAAVKAKLGLYYSSHNVGATLPPADLEQLFIGMLVARIPVTDGPRIEAAMLDYFRQMDAFVSSANTIYQDNLSRQLEPEEEAALRDKFRAHDTDLNGIVAAVRGSFEYMHVLHDMVSSIAADLGVDSGKGKVFKLIESLIADNHDKSKVTLCMQARRLLSTA